MSTIEDPELLELAYFFKLSVGRPIFLNQLVPDLEIEHFY